MQMSGWSRYPCVESMALEPSSPLEAKRLQNEFAGVIPRGNGRAYGDAAIGKTASLCLRRLDRLCSFDESSGRLVVEAGVLLDDILAEFVPRGFFPPVVPGTKFVTIGGMIAADVHGKNHHGAGSFGEYIESLMIALPNGEIVSCSPLNDPDLFDATIGGMGLTGTILQATFRLLRIESGWIKQNTIVAPDLAAALNILALHEDAPYVVAWIDCLAKGAKLGRSLLYLGEHASDSDIETLAPGAARTPRRRLPHLAVPVDFPGFALNRWSVGAFNEVYFRMGAAKAAAPRLSDLDTFFFPLDGILEWNRIYGKRGFLQYQCIVPVEQAQDTISEILDRCSRRGNCSFLAVLKKLGKASRGLMSFPFPGVTLALDLTIDRGVFDFLDEIDALIVAAGGRVYLAKDARQSRATFEAGYPNLQRFRELRQRIEAPNRLASRLSERLGI